MSFNVEICTTENQIKEALDIRRDVFCFDYGYKPEDLTDNLDSHSIHFLVRNQNREPVASLRFSPEPLDYTIQAVSNVRSLEDNEKLFLTSACQGGRFWWLSVIKSARNNKLSTLLIKTCENYLTKYLKQMELNETYMKLRANYAAHQMYKKYGYDIDGEPFILNDQKLVWMIKKWNL